MWMTKTTVFFYVGKTSFKSAWKVVFLFFVFLFSSFSSTVLFNIFICFLINFFSFFCWIRYIFSCNKVSFVAYLLLGDKCTDAHLHRLASALQVLSVCFSFCLLLFYVLFLFFFLFYIMFCSEQRSDVLDVTEQQHCFGKTVRSWTVVIHFDTFHTFRQKLKNPTVTCVLEKCRVISKDVFCQSILSCFADDIH